MKKILSLSVLVVAFLFPGCASSPQTAQFSAVVKITARRGVFELVKFRPQYRDGAVRATQALDVFLALDNPTPAALDAALAPFDIGSIKGDSAALAIQDVKDLVDLLTGGTFGKLDTSGLKQIVTALNDGLKQGLGIVPVVPTPSSPGSSSIPLVFPVTKR